MNRELIKLVRNNFSIRVDSDIIKEMKKWEICWGMLRLNKNFVTDIAYSNYVIDVIDISSATAYFLVNSPQHLPEVLDGYTVQVVNYRETRDFKSSISRTRIEREKKRRSVSFYE